MGINGYCLIFPYIYIILVYIISTSRGVVKGSRVKGKPQDVNTPPHNMRPENRDDDLEAGPIMSRRVG